MRAGQHRNAKTQTAHTGAKKAGAHIRESLSVENCPTTTRQEEKGSALSNGI
jgi:hypothetical protein